MSKPLYSNWLASLGVHPENMDADHKTAFKKAYEWAMDHPSADRYDIQRKIGESLDGKTGDNGILPSWLAGPARAVRNYVTDLADPSVALGQNKAKPSLIRAPASTPTDPASAAAPPSAAQAAKPDAASAAAATTKGDPALQAAIQAALAGGTAGTVTLWSGVGVDPDAPVFGDQRNTATTNTMDKTGRLVHGTGSTEGIGIEPTTQSADAWLKGLYKMSPQDLADLQHRLYGQGWYRGTGITDPSMIEYGRPDAATTAAYGSALGEGARYLSAGTHISINQVIDLGSPAPPDTTGPNRASISTNPADLKSALKSQAQQDIGRDPRAGDVQGFAQGYLADEEAARRQLVSANATNANVGITGPPSPSAGAEQYIDTHNLADKVAYGAAVRQQAFFSMLKSPV